MNYKEILQAIVDRGVPKQPVRGTEKVENGTIGLFCENFRHDMSQGFPLTTLRQVPWKSLRIELEGFIRGITDKSWYKSEGCNFWNEWANPIAAKDLLARSKELDLMIEADVLPDMPEGQQPGNLTLKDAQLLENDLGPIYGYQWRHFDQHYGEYETWEVGEPNPAGDYQMDSNINGLWTGADQLKSVVDQLKTNPYDRRMLVLAWNPNQLHMMALPPCHYGFTVVVYGNKLNLCWKQRSVDTVLGLPANIASYALLMLLLCEESGLEPGELYGVLEDCHIYENHLPAVHELLKRDEKSLPQVLINKKDNFSIFDWTWKDVTLIGYDPHPKMNMGAVTV